MVLYGDKSENREIIDKYIADSYDAISSLKPPNVSDSVAVKSIGAIPTETWNYIKQLIQQITGHVEQEAQLQELVAQQVLVNRMLSETNKSLSDELQNIKSSKLWKAMRIVRFGSYSARHPIGGAKRMTHHVRTATRHH